MSPVLNGDPLACLRRVGPQKHRYAPQRWTPHTCRKVPVHADLYCSRTYTLLTVNRYFVKHKMFEAFILESIYLISPCCGLSGRKQCVGLPWRRLCSVQYCVTAMHRKRSASPRIVLLSLLLSLGCRFFFYHYVLTSVK